MGVPKFYRWLTQRYPLISQKIKKEEDIPPIDNLYVDMNGMVHNIIHANGVDKLIVTSRLMSSGQADEIWAELFRTLDDLVHLINPRKLLMIALDGVTPAAKMTQQRSRRIKGIRALESVEELARQQHDEIFDINAISPGTEFMEELNRQIDFFIRSKLNEDPLYQKIQIIFSDSNVPGEGEHKIMEYLRCFRKFPEYDPNYRHCLYGLDADLILLSLISHEPNLIIIREVVDSRQNRSEEVISLARQVLLKSPEYEIIYISILREYFELEFKFLESKITKFTYDVEHIIDDFVFFSFFVGNDFIAYLNSVDINFGSLDLLIEIYKNCLPTIGYLIENGNIKWENAEKIFSEIAKYELKVFQDRITEARKPKPTEKKWVPRTGKDGKFEGDPVVPEPVEEEPQEEDVKLNIPLESSLEFMNKMCSAYEKDKEEGKRMYYLEIF